MAEGIRVGSDLCTTSNEALRRRRLAAAVFGPPQPVVEREALLPHYEAPKLRVADAQDVVGLVRHDDRRNDECERTAAMQPAAPDFLACAKRSRRPLAVVARETRAGR